MTKNKYVKCMCRLDTIVLSDVCFTVTQISLQNWQVWTFILRGIEMCWTFLLVLRLLSRCGRVTIQLSDLQAGVGDIRKAPNALSLTLSLSPCPPFHLWTVTPAQCPGTPVHILWWTAWWRWCSYRRSYARRFLETLWCCWYSSASRNFSTSPTVSCLTCSWPTYCRRCWSCPSPSPPPCLRSGRWTPDSARPLWCSCTCLHSLASTPSLWYP